MKKMKNTFNLLQEVLKEIPEIWDKDDNEKLLKEKLNRWADRCEEKLIQKLLENPELKKVYFKEISCIHLFLADKFIKTINHKEFLPDSYTSYAHYIGLSCNREFIRENKDVVLDFPYKDCVLEGGQTKEEQKLKEVFYNEILANDEIDRLLEPKAFKNIKKFSKEKTDPLKEEKISEFKETDNILIRGNNLLALHSLSEKFSGKVKLIYIDPPYNTGNDSFGYNDKFNHSSWLLFMKNRLEIARKFLKQDGVIAVQCSFHEFGYLKVLMDELFPKFLCSFNIQVRHPDRILTGDKEYNDIMEYILIYSINLKCKMPKREEIKTDDKYIYYIEEKTKGEIINLNGKNVEIFTPDKYILTKKESNNKLLTRISIRGSIREKNSSGRLYVKSIEQIANKYPPETLFKVPDMGDDSIGHRYFYTPPEGNINGGYYQGKPTSSNITEKPYPNFFNFEKEYNNVASQGAVSFRNGKKPEELINFLVDIFTNENDEIVLDYHLGSGTTASVAHKMNRQWIGIEQLDYKENDSVNRIKNVLNGEESGISKSVNWQGGGNFVYLELAEENSKYIEIIDKCTTKEMISELKQEIIQNAVIRYEVDEEKFFKTDEIFNQLSLEEQKTILKEVLDKNHLYVNYSEIEDSKHSFTKEELAFNYSFYGKDKE